ncbi:MAG TPA: MarR family transcriptional regulator, partial [Ruminococcaceae bacterium]|nr:MarR family transcriptional regulator [Oscillospiraceae bacterium]
RSTASKVINLMEQKGLVERQSVSCDARLKKIVMTDKSKAISHLMAEDMDLVESVLTDGFSSEEKKALYNYLKRMKQNLKSYYLKEKEE